MITLVSSQKSLNPNISAPSVCKRKHSTFCILWNPLSPKKDYVIYEWYLSSQGSTVHNVVLDIPTDTGKLLDYLDLNNSRGKI